MKLLSVHVPKTGGTSIKKLLTAAYGDRVLLDYDEDPADPRSPRNTDTRSYLGRQRLFPEGVDAIHGHLHPGQFAISGDTLVFGLLRHPVQNLISIFHFWQTHVGEKTSLHEAVLEAKLDIFQTAQLPYLQNLYTSTYFGEFDMGRFDILGRHENRSTHLDKLAVALGQNLDTESRVNITPPTDARLAFESEPANIRRLESILAKDIHFYERYAPN